MERDGNRCIITRQSKPEIAHIFPYCMLNTPPLGKEWKASNFRPKFWDLLSLFWDKDRIDKWKSKIFPNAEKPNTGVEVPTISSASRAMHMVCGTMVSSHSNHWNFQAIIPSLLFNSSGKFRTSTSLQAVLICLRNLHHQKA